MIVVLNYVLYSVENTLAAKCTESFHAEAVTVGVDGTAGAAGAVGADDGGRLGAGDDTRLPVLPISMSTPALLLFSLFSLSIWLFSLFSLLLSPEADSSEIPSALVFGGAFQRGNSQTTPVKLFNLKLPFCHLRHGFPERSSALRPALIAPWLAFGPSLWAVPLAALGVVFEWSIVPSSL